MRLHKTNFLSVLDMYSCVRQASGVDASHSKIAIVLSAGIHPLQPSSFRLLNTWSASVSWRKMVMRHCPEQQYAQTKHTIRNDDNSNIFCPLPNISLPCLRGKQLRRELDSHVYHRSMHVVRGHLSRSVWSETGQVPLELSIASMIILTSRRGGVE